MHTILLVIQVLLAISIIALVLIQHGKGADAGAAFGSGASGTVFGSRGTANFLSRATAALAALFFACSLSLAYLVHSTGSQAGASVVNQVKTQTPQQPVLPKQGQPAQSGQTESQQAPAQQPSAQGQAPKSQQQGSSSGNIPEAPPASSQGSGQ